MPASQACMHSVGQFIESGKAGGAIGEGVVHDGVVLLGDDPAALCLLGEQTVVIGGSCSTPVLEEDPVLSVAHLISAARRQVGGETRHQAAGCLDRPAGDGQGRPRTRMACTHVTG